MADYIITVKHLYKTYGDGIKTPVLHDINFEIKRNSFTALIGPSGSGKSTLLSCLGLLDPPTSGEIIIDNNNYSKIDVNELSVFRNENIGFVFQFHYLLPEFTTFENILIPYWIRTGRPQNALIKETHELMDRIGIGNIKNKYINQISGGQQQRVAIARAIINKPKVILADEPTGNLDRETGMSVLELMKKINLENNTTLILVTHDRDIALKSDRILELIDGKICKSIDLSSTSKRKVEKVLNQHTCTFNE